jgi:hypothetical protein
MSLLCPTCLAVVPDTTSGRNERNTVCPHCQTMSGPGELLHSESLHELISPPAWVRRREEAGRTTVLVRNGPPNVLTLLGVVGVLAVVTWIVFFRPHAPAAALSPPVLAIVGVMVLYLMWRAALPLFGGVRLTLTPGRLDIFEGIGPLGRGWTIDPASVQCVRRATRPRRGRYAQGTYELIEIVATPEAAFAADFPDDRLAFIQAAVWEMTLGRRRKSPG